MKKFSSTMKASSRRASRNKRLSQFGLFAVGLLLAAMVLPALFSGITALITSPFNAIREWVTSSTDSFPNYWRERSAINEEIKALETEIATSRSNNLTLRLLQEENSTLRQHLNAEHKDRILASVIARPNRLPYDLIQLDRGSADGIQVDAPVFLGLDQVVGLITHVGKNHSFATLVSSPGFSSTVYIIGPNIYTPAEGIGGGILRVRVPQGIDLTVGNMVVLPAIESGIYGEIVLVEATPTEPEQYGYVSSGVPLQSLRFVTVGTEPLREQTFEEAGAHVDIIKQALFTVPVPAGVLVDITTASTTATSTDRTNDTETP